MEATEPESSPTFIDAHVTRAQVESGAWVRPEHAARALGCDERTIRRRVRSGWYARTVVAGRVYIRQGPRPEPPLHPPEPEPEHVNERVTTALAVIVREQATRLEQLARELTLARVEAARLEHEHATERERAGALAAQLTTERNEREQAQARAATVEQLERARLADAATVLDARRALEREQATAAELARQLAQARDQAAREQARAAHLEQLARAPWYAVRVRRQLRRELATGTA